MAISTIKFSQFPTAVVGDQSNIPVGLGAGINAQIPPYVWTVSTRPATPFNGLLGYNTDLSQYEYWNAATSAWDQLAATGTSFAWSEVVGPSISAEINNGYAANNDTSRVIFTLPPTMNLGDTIKIRGLGTAGWSIVASGSQQIIFGDEVSSVAGSWSSTLQYDSLTVEGLITDSVWSITQGVGNFTQA
jgi:hypothetical protein